MNKLGLFLTNDVDFTKAVEPVVALIKGATSAILIIFAAAMGVLSIVHAFSYAKADEPQQKQVAKQKLNNLIIAFVLAFALLVLFSTMDKILTDWVKGVIKAASQNASGS